MEISVEFFGIPRQRAGQPDTTLLLTAPVTLGTLLEELARRFPGLDGECIEQGVLRPGCLASLDGDRFVRDPAEVIVEGTSVLILSAEVGG